MHNVDRYLILTSRIRVLNEVLVILISGDVVERTLGDELRLVAGLMD